MSDNKAHTASNALAPGNFDRAWNDPPLFSYTANPSVGTSRTSLNKRVAFPGMSAGAAPLPPPGMDPTAPPPLYDLGCKPPVSSLPPPPPQGDYLVKAGEGGKDLGGGENQSVDEVQSLFTKLIENYFDGQKCTDLLGRLSIMFKKWRDGSLNPRICDLVAHIGACLDRKELREAELKFETLSADHGGEGGNSAWILAVRHIFTQVKTEVKKGENDEAGVTAPL